jgi:ADP-heptose:LPS heptosyltransferase
LEKERVNILVIRLSALGDVAMTVPLIAKVANSYNVKITVLTKKTFEPLFMGLDNIDVFCPDLNNEHKGFWGIFKLYLALRNKADFSAVVDLHNVLRTKFLRFLFQVEGTPTYFIHKDRKARKALTRRQNKHLTPLTKIQDAYAKVFSQLGIDVSLKKRTFEINKLPLPLNITQITGEKEDNATWIGIAAFAKHEPKIYPIEKMEKVLEYFSKRPNTKVFLFGGGKKEVDILKTWEEKYPNSISLAGILFFEDELRLMRYLDCMVSMDSGNMHLANMVNTPVLSIWGGTHPYAGFISVGNKKSKQVQLDLECRPCSIYGNKPCYKGTLECMNNIKPEIVINAIEEILKK